MADESESDDEYESDFPNFEPEEKAISVDVSDDEMSDTGVPILESESHDSSDSPSSSKESEDYHDVSTEMDPRADEVSQTSRYPTRHRKPLAWTITNAAKYCNYIAITTSDEPTLAEAMSATPKKLVMCLTAIGNEFESLNSKETWKLDDSQRQEALYSHVVLRVKRKSDGSTEPFKARIVANRNFQYHSNDYFESYAPDASFPLVRIFLCLVLYLNMFIAQLDMKTAYMNGLLDESVSVISPRGINGKTSRCYKLRKAKNRLKQINRHILHGIKNLCSMLLDIEFKELPSAPYVFRRKCGSSNYSYILSYVVYMLVLTVTVSKRERVQKQIQEMFEVKVSDEFNLLLGVQLEWELVCDGCSLSLELSQTLFIEGMLTRFGLENSTPSRTPMVKNFFTSCAVEGDKFITDVQLFHQMIGPLLFHSLQKRLDTLAPVLILACFQRAPTQYFYRAAERRLCCLRGTPDHSITYRGGWKHFLMQTMLVTW